MKQFKRIMVFVLATLLLVTAVPAQNVEAKKPKKLTKKDFVYNGWEKTSFIKESNVGESYARFFYEVTGYKKGFLGNLSKSFKTKRKIGLGDSKEKILKKYGKTKTKKVKSDEKLYKIAKYEFTTVDITTWKTYLQYKYKNEKDSYIMRFYLNKKGKVAAIVYVKNLNKWKNWAKKEIDPKIKFVAPSGKKIVKKKMYGKQVYILPKGTKIYGKTQETMEQYLSLYDLSLEEIAENRYYRPVYLTETGEEITEFLESELYTIGEEDYESFDLEQMEEYAYFRLVSYDWTEKKAPQIIYFRIK